MCTGRPSWQTMNIRQAQYKKTHQKIYINLVDVLEVNTSKLVYVLYYKKDQNNNSLFCK